MQCWFQNLWRAGVLLALLLAPARLTAQDHPQAAQSPAAGAEQPPAVPDLADLIPLATALSDRLASLEKTIADSGGLPQVEPQLREVVARMDEDAQQLLALKASSDTRAGRLRELQAQIEWAGDTLTRISKTVTAEVRRFGHLQQEWLAEQTHWNAWQAALNKAEPLEEITATVTKAQGAITTALGLLRQQLKPLLALQEQVGTLQTRTTTLTGDVQELLLRSQGGVAGEAAPAMFSARYVAQLATTLSAGVQTGLVQISWPGASFVAEEGWLIVLQAVLSVGLALVFFRHRQELEQLNEWRFIAARPLAAAVLVGVLSVVGFYGRLPDIVRLVMSVILGTAFARLVGGLVEGGWRRQVVYGLATLLVITNLLYTLGLPLALFRLYLLVAALVSLVFCLRWAAVSRRLSEPRLYVWVLRVAAAFFAVVLFTEVRGSVKPAEFLFVASLRTLGIVIVFGLLRHLLRGGLEWAVLRSAARGAVLVRSNATVVAQRLALVGDVLVGAVILSVLLMTWQVYESPSAAITGLLSGQVTLGSQRITIGLVLLAVGSLGSSYIASWLLQTLMAENVLARRNVDTGVSLAVTRLLHYALVSIGFVIALAVLGVDLTQVTLLVSALGVGIGFGLQTIVNNFVCGLILLFERPLRVGDTIELGGRWAKITKIGLRSTTVRTLDQADVIVPNADLITNQVTNWTLTDRHARGIIAVKVVSGSDVALVMQTLKECALADPGVMKEPEPRILFRNLGGGSLDFELHVWIVDVDHRLQVESDLRQEIERRFRQVGIAIPS